METTIMNAAASEAQMTFKRYEIKYKLTRSQVSRLMEAMQGHMELDCYGHSTIRNIYFDTDTFRLVRRSIDKPLYKEKLRLRAYQKCEDDSPAFVELKKKFEGVVYKRRLMLPYRDAMDALSTGMLLPDHSQIGREIEAFRGFYGGTLKPAMMLTYEREAYAPVDGMDFRFTLDENILWRTDKMDLGASVWGNRILMPDEVLMEVKTPGGIPLWMTHFLNENNIRQISFSKYGTAYQQLMSASHTNGGRKYA